jgi:hypothetical protein
MKTSKTLRNTALTLMLVFTASYAFSQNHTEPSGNLNREKAEFANAGYWIDAVLVNASPEKSDRERLANKGYFIEPVVVRYGYTTPDYLEKQDATVLYTLKKSSEDLEISMLDKASER